MKTALDFNIYSWYSYNEFLVTSVCLLLAVVAFQYGWTFQAKDIWERQKLDRNMWNIPCFDCTGAVLYATLLQSEMSKDFLPDGNESYHIKWTENWIVTEVSQFTENSVNHFTNVSLALTVADKWT